MYHIDMCWDLHLKEFGGEQSYETYQDKEVFDVYTLKEVKRESLWRHQ